ncbi:MAG: ABC transporter substrate-binding protein [Holosporales bacterium]|jgi:polar amino acid transport system substrate-binding protein|nr:ABC transporter substrate-binding protein [Holosporales bacterium]
MRRSLRSFWFFTGLVFLFTSTGGKAEESAEESSAVPQEIIVATSSDYPPFEFSQGGEFVGFDIDLAKLLAEKLGAKVTFKDLPFASILAALQNGTATIAISTLENTEERSQNFDFSDPYYQAKLAILCRGTDPVFKVEMMAGKDVGCQMGSTMERWVRTNVPDAKVVTFDSIATLVQVLVNGAVKCAVMDAYQARKLSHKEKGKKTGIGWAHDGTNLESKGIEGTEGGYAVMMPKGSPLKERLNKALAELKASGEIQKLEEKWGLTDLPS